MSQTDVSEEVQELIYQLATQRISERIEMAGSVNAVLYLGVTASIEIRPSETGDMRVEGSRTSMGLSEDEARRSADSIRVQMDKVADFDAEGPHPGEVFEGTDSSDGERPLATSASSGDDWAVFRDRIGMGLYGLRTRALFPELADAFNPTHPNLDSALKNSIRISIQREKMEALTLPRSLYTERLTSVFHTNYSGDEYVQGPVGRVDVTVFVPKGVTLTVFGAESVDVHDVEANLFLINCQGSTIEEAKGAMHLLNTPLENAADLEGSIYQRFHSYGGVSSAGERAKRTREYTSNLERISGEVDIDVGGVDIRAKGLSGDIRLRNRFGTTELALGKDLEGSRFTTYSAFGTVRIRLAKSLLPEVAVTAVTICGTIDYAALSGLKGRRTANTQQLTFVSTAKGTGEDLLAADVVAQTESGDIVFEVDG